MNLTDKAFAGLPTGNQEIHNNTPLSTMTHLPPLPTMSCEEATRGIQHIVNQFAKRTNSIQ